MSALPIIIIIVLVVVVVLIGAAVWMAARRRSLQKRFGPEYNRVVSEQDSRLAAERELRARERRHAELDLRPLSEESRASYSTAWDEIQARFVDQPKEAVGAADDLVTRLIAERGYPTENFDDQLAQLSVEHARTLEHYRDAHQINLRNQQGEASTEQLRQAVVHYRALFSDLLGETSGDHATRTETVERTETVDADRTDTDDADRAETVDADAAAPVPPTGERSSDARPERAS
jgi:FtsZ-interacting cell division protein ZipA